jgi:hypothetical protein
MPRFFLPDSDDSDDFDYTDTILKAIRNDEDLQQFVSDDVDVDDIQGAFKKVLEDSQGMTVGQFYDKLRIFDPWYGYIHHMEGYFKLIFKGNIITYPMLSDLKDNGVVDQFFTALIPYLSDVKLLRKISDKMLGVNISERVLLTLLRIMLESVTDLTFFNTICNLIDEGEYQLALYAPELSQIADKMQIMHQNGIIPLFDDSIECILREINVDNYYLYYPIESSFSLENQRRLINTIQYYRQASLFSASEYRANIYPDIHQVISSYIRQ